MNKIKKLAIVAVVLIGTFAYLSRDMSVSETILISANIPLTGDLAVYGQYIQQGSEMGYEELKGSYPHVSEIMFDWQDNRGNLADAASVFHKQNLEKPDLYISGLKPQTAAITQLVTENNIPHFTWILDVTINEKSSNNIRNWVNFKKEAEVFVDYLSQKSPKRVYMVYVNLESAVSEYEGIVRPALLNMGLKNEDIITEAFNLTRTDFKDIALKIKEANPDQIIINGFIPHIVSMTKDFRNLGVMNDYNTIASIDMLDTAHLLNASEIEGVVVASPGYLLDESTEVQNWKIRFEDKFKRVPTYHDAYAYDSIRVILEAYNEFAPSTHEELIKAIKSVDVVGLTGKIKFDSDGSSITEMYPAVYRSGLLVPLK